MVSEEGEQIPVGQASAEDEARRLEIVRLEELTRLGELGDIDVHLFNEGTHTSIYEKLGAHPAIRDGQPGFRFAVWAPSAEYVAVIGDFNNWTRDANPLAARGSSGIWEVFVPGLQPAQCYKFHIRSHYYGYSVDKADPVGFLHEEPPRTASVTWDLRYEWSDQTWMTERERHQGLHVPMAIYEVHLGSWARVPEEGNRWLTYREIAPKLADYVNRMGFTHVEFLPVMEHPFYASWGYQVTGYYAPTRRYGSPQDFMYLVDYLHRQGIGVILDWVPAHFPQDQHGLGYFDGTHLYEHADSRQGFHPDWQSFIFNYGRHDVRSFLLSSASFWLDKYHADGLRVDGVASMLYLDYSRSEGQWVPNEYGGRENIAAIYFLRRLNEVVYSRFPGIQTVAEESTAWPMVSKPTYVGGLGFGFKWDMGWMHDTIEYIRRDPVYRRYHHNELTFRLLYAFHENFVLPFSHDECVHGKGSMLGKMPGDHWQRFANLRLLYAYMYATPGKKMMFMGCEIGQVPEWHHDNSVEWHLLDVPEHRGIADLVAHLNRTYRSEPALYRADCEPAGFEWIEPNDAEHSALSFIRRTPDGREQILVVLNFTPTPRHNYRVGVSRSGFWREIINTDAREYGGSGQGNLGGVHTCPAPFHGREHSMTITVPPLGAVFFKSVGQA